MNKLSLQKCEDARDGAMGRISELLRREIAHRCNNDLQLVISMLALEQRRGAAPDTRHMLQGLIDRIGILARSRAALARREGLSLEEALREVCTALQSQVEQRAILVSLEVPSVTGDIGQDHVTVLALGANELATNAIKHAFGGDGGGRVRISVRDGDGKQLVVMVDDDGQPLAQPIVPAASPHGLGFVSRLLASVDGTLRIPEGGGKRFEMCVPLTRRRHQRPNPNA